MKFAKYEIMRPMPAKKVKTARLPLLSLSILECDAKKLMRQNLSVARDISNIVRTIPKRLTVEVAPIDSQQELLDKCAEYKQKYRGIKVVVVIAHSNSEVISLAPDLSYTPWSVFGQWLKPFNPQKLVCIACKAGQYPPSRILFDEIPKLTEIFASPVELWIHQVEAMKLLIPYLLMANKTDADLIKLGQWIMFMRNGGIILHIKRRQTEWNDFFQFLGALRDLAAAAG
jgi:hypothetical protein